MPASFRGVESLESRCMLSVSLDGDGWTVVGASADTRVVYVSNSTGSDMNNGLSASTPVKSLGKAASLLRPGMPDWILLKRDDFWSESIFLNAGGRSVQEPVLISSYGTGARPRLADGRVFVNADNVAVIGLHFEGQGKFSNPDNEAIDLTYNAARSNLLFEDLEIEGYRVGLKLQWGQHITLRRSVIHDNSALGLWTADSDHFLLEENVFDFNGIDENQNHNIYKGPGTTNFVVRYNVIARGANYGLKWRAPHDTGEIYGNLFTGNRNDLAIHLDNENDPNFLTTNVKVRDNVFVESGAGSQQNPIYVSHAKDLLIKDNLIVNMDHTPYGQAIRLAYTFENANSNLTNVRITGNTIANFTGTGIGLLTSKYDGIQIDNNVFQNLPNHIHQIRANYTPGAVTYAGNTYHASIAASQWFELGYHNYLGLSQWESQVGETGALSGLMQYSDPTRTVSSYHGMLGKTATLEAFLAEAVTLSKTNWNKKYLAETVTGYIRRGFNPILPPGITVSAPNTLVTTETGSRSTFSVVLDARPAADVTIQLHVSDAAEASLSTSTLVFTPDDWDLPRVVRVYGVNDDIVDGNKPYTVSFEPAVSTDPDYSGRTLPAIDLTNVDDDTDTGGPTLSFPYSAVRVIRSSSVSPTSGYNFTVKYFDQSGVDTGTLATGNLLVTGPNGYNQLASFISATPGANGTTLATYRFNPPGGSWDPGDNAYYRVLSGPSPARDILGKDLQSASSGTLIVYIDGDAAVPRLSTGLNAAAVTDASGAGAGAYSFKLTYMPQDAAIKSGSIGDGDIEVVNSKGYRARAKLVYRERGKTPGSIVAKYRIVPPGGTWNAADSANYTLRLQKGEVRDIEGRLVPGGNMGKFSVAVTVPGSLPGTGSSVLVVTSWTSETVSSSLETTSPTTGLFNTETRILDAAYAS